MKPQEIYIEGYWKDSLEAFSGYLCLITNGSDEVDFEDEYKYFHFFDNWNDLGYYTVDRDYVHAENGEFIITKITTV